MTAINGPFGFCTGRPMQVEQMTAIIAWIRFFQWHAKSSLTIIGYTVIIIEEPTHERGNLKLYFKYVSTEVMFEAS